MSYIIELYQRNNLPKTFLRQSNFFCSSFELGLGSRMATIDLNIGLHQIKLCLHLCSQVLRLSTRDRSFAISSQKKELFQISMGDLLKASGIPKIPELADALKIFFNRSIISAIVVILVHPPLSETECPEWIIHRMLFRNYFSTAF